MIRPSSILAAPSLGRALAEVSIIVVGVLIALGADAWRERRSEDRMAEEYRAALIDDLVADSVLYGILVDQGWFPTQAEAVDSLTAFLADPDREVEPVTLVQWWWGMVRLGVGSKASATFDDMRSSGRLSLIREPELRRALIDYYAFPIWVEDGAYGALRDFVVGRIPGIATRLFGPTAYAVVDTCNRTAVDENGDQPLESAPLRACLEASRVVTELDMGAALRRDPEVLEAVAVMSNMRILGLDGSIQGREEAAVLRSWLRREVDVGVRPRVQDG